MRITDLLKACSVELNGTPQTKEETIKQMVALMEKGGNVTDVEKYKAGVFAREEEGTTGIGEGIAIPHAKTDAVNAPGLAAMVIPAGVDYDALDGQPVDLVFLIAAPNTEDNVHLEVLSRLSMLLMDESFKQNLLKAKTVEEFLAVVDRAENAKNEAEEEKAVNVPDSGYRVLAVTACPTGIAHTYMAAESLENTAKELGYTIKVETNGSGGDKNVLTAEEIAACDGIIVAADKEVRMARFDGKPVIVTKVADGIHKPQELIEDIINGRAKVYHNDGKGEENAGIGDESLGRKLYKALMNGVSHMLPFVVGGGILIAIAFLIDGLLVDMNSLDAAARSNFGTITPAAAMFKQIGGVAFGFMLPVLAGYIAMAIGDRPALALGFVGGMMASSGTSGFLGALVAGFAAGYIILVLRKACEKLPEALEKIAPVLIYPVVGILAMGLLMLFIVEPIMGTVNTVLNNGLASMGGSSKLILGMILGGMMAIDMGGPFNKAAYVFGTAAIAAGNYDIMASVMIGGMVPPIAIALANTFFKNRWTDEERKNAPVNYVMGLSFISEGAIPYAAGHPLQVIPSCIVGSAVAGAFSALFGCKLMAPHGGIFVFATMQGTWYFYLLALAIGAVIGMFMLALLKKPLNREIKKVK